MLVKDAPAFVVNRLLTRALGEVIAAVDEGTPFEVADTALEPLGLPMSPLVLLQLVGPAVALHVAETLHEAFPDRYGVSSNLARSSRQDVHVYLGRGKPCRRPRGRARCSRATPPSRGDEVLDRALAALAQEIRLMLDEGVVAEPQDIDLCMLLGAGWPFHLGGITPYLDRTGISERVTGARFLPNGAPTSHLIWLSQRACDRTASRCAVDWLRVLRGSPSRRTRWGTCCRYVRHVIPQEPRSAMRSAHRCAASCSRLRSCMTSTWFRTTTAYGWRRGVSCPGLCSRSR